ncbi:MAG: hypothetical protein ABL974_10140 [Prosthecobacter sp.]
MKPEIAKGQYQRKRAIPKKPLLKNEYWQIEKTYHLPKYAAGIAVYLP